LLKIRNLLLFCKQEGHPVPEQVDAALELLETWAE